MERTGKGCKFACFSFGDFKFSENLDYDSEQLIPVFLSNSIFSVGLFHASSIVRLGTAGHCIQELFHLTLLIGHISVFEVAF